MRLAESPVKAALIGTCTAGTGPDLTGYPYLVYAPAQWGDGVRCQSNGTLAHSIASVARHLPIEEVASDYNVGVREVLDALLYARAARLI